MNISKLELVELLLDYANGNEIASQIIAEANKHKNLIWSQDEWVYVKDVEAALRAMKKLYENGDFSQFSQIKEIILGSESVAEMSDSWLKNRVLDCRFNLDCLYFQP